ncbi:MAG TPA: NAD-dependent epimerase/dehydratase family protein [Candidatus Saccharimonadia bacterium]|nr:NAD-dependent epimerase/dehydratase family protein [Candidatus Saccharimonadia bacterium]
MESIGHEAKTVLVTGGAGHVGSHVIEQLLAQYPAYRVISLDNYSNGHTLNHIAGAEYRAGDTKNIAREVPEQPDIVYHLGEYARIAPSFTEPERVYELNVQGTFAVAEFCRQRGAKLVYAASSTKFAIEGDGRHQNPYSFTKATNVDLINDYGRWYNLPYAICYFYNAYGPREKGTGQYATLIAKFEQKYLRGEPFTVVRPGTQKRNFTYVGDLARGLILTGERGQGDGYALGNTNGFSIVEIAEAFGGPIEYIDGYPGRAESGQAPTKARQELGWDTTVDILDYIRDFVREHPRAGINR